MRPGFLCFPHRPAARRSSFVLDDILDLFERDKKKSGSPKQGGVRGLLNRLSGDDDRRGCDEQQRRYDNDDDDDHDDRPKPHKKRREFDFFGDDG
jgi:hypothetical protein